MLNKVLLVLLFIQLLINSLIIIYTSVGKISTIYLRK